MAHQTDLGYMRKYLNATQDHRRWLEEQVEPHRKYHHERVLEAEEVYRKRCQAPLGMTYPNTNYWDKWGQAINGYVYTLREEAARRVLEETYHEIDVEFDRRTEEIKAIFESRVKQAIYRATQKDGTFK